MSFLTHSQRPSKCPKCFSRNIVSSGGTHYCLDCEFEWNREDEIRAQGMQPKRRDGLLGFLLRFTEDDIEE